MPQAFLNHKEEDKTLVLELFEHFQRSFIECWIDKQDIPVGSELAGEIFRGIGQSSYFLPFISNYYLTSSWCLEELKAAYSNYQKKQIKILPILLEPMNKLDLENLDPNDKSFLENFLQRYKYIEFDLYNKEKSIKAVADAIWQSEPIAFEPIKTEIVDGFKLQVIRFNIKIPSLPDDFFASWQLDVEKFHEQGSGKNKIIKSDLPVAFNGKAPNWFFCYLSIPFKNLNDVFIFNSTTKGYICAYSKRNEHLGKVLKQ